MIGYTLDAGALIALDRDDRRVIALLAQARATGARVTIPATALAQAVRDPSRQVQLSRLVRRPTTVVPHLDDAMAVQVGRLLAVSRTSDIADAHVVLCARIADETVVTSDPGDLWRLDPDLRLVPL